MGDRVIAFGKYDLCYPKCPIQIEQFKLYYSEDDRKTYICFKFVNFFDVEIQELRFNLVCFDKNKKPIGAYKDYYYNPKSAKKYQEFGYDNKFEIPCYGCQTAMLAFTTVTFKDGNVWKYQSQENMLPPLPKLAKPITPDIPHFQQINIELKKHSAERIKFNPLFTAHGWICTCGMANVLDNEECLSCKLNKSDLMDSFNDEYLTEQEKLERERKEKEYRERDEKLRKQREAAFGNKLVNLELVEVKKSTAQVKKVETQKPIVLEELVLEEVKEVPKKAKKPIKLELIEEPLELVEEKVVAPKPVGPRPVSPRPVVSQAIKPVVKPIENTVEEHEDLFDKIDELIEQPVNKAVDKKAEKIASKKEKEDKSEKQEKGKFSLFRHDKKQKDDSLDVEVKEEKSKGKPKKEEIKGKLNKDEDNLEKQEEIKEEVIAKPKENSDFLMNFDDVDKPMEEKEKNTPVTEKEVNVDDMVEPLDLSDWLV